MVFAPKMDRSNHGGAQQGSAAAVAPRREPFFLFTPRRPSNVARIP